MTQDPLPAGRDLDRLLAEHVFGETCTCKSEDISRQVNPFGVPWLCRLHGNRDSCPPYSTEIYFAWKVVEKFKPEVEIVGLRSGDWRVWLGGELGVAGHGFAATAPHAICLAALITKGVPLK